MTPDQDGLIPPDDEELLRRVERSQVWRLIRDALCMERERLFAGNSTISGLSGQPSTNETLWMNRGAILLIQHLLHGAPWFVVQYKHHMAEQAEKRVNEKGTMKQPEREFTARPATDEKLDFDL